MKVGEYVRTKDGVIAQITDILEDLSIDCDRDVYDLDDIDNLKMMEIPYCCKDEYIIKSSPNIIDLIEENDFVNHSRVVCIAISTDLSGIHKYLVLENGNNCANGNIESIVTKEQFESMEYRIGE